MELVIFRAWKTSALCAREVLSILEREVPALDLWLPQPMGEGLVGVLRYQQSAAPPVSGIAARSAVGMGDVSRGTGWLHPPRISLLV